MSTGSEARPSTAWAVVIAVSVAVAMIGQQLAGKAIRDAFFLSYFEPSALPTVMMLASGLSIAVVLGTSRMYRAVPPARLVPWVFIGSAGWFVGEWFLSASFPEAVSVSLYIHTTSFGAVVVSGFWSVVNERFDPYTARRVIGRIAGGATLGGVLGGFAAWQGARFLSVGSFVLALGLANLLCGVLMRMLASGMPQTPAGPRSSTGKEPSVLGIMEETPYLWQLAFLVGTGALAAAGFDYVFKARAAETFTESKDLVSFFSLFYLGLGLGTFVFQQLFAGRALQFLGLTATVASLPAAVVGLSGLSLVVGGFWSVLALRALAAVLESSLYRSGYELLYTPLTPEKKRPTKTMIDVGADKFGAAVGGGLTLVVVQAFPGSSGAVLLVVAVLCGLIGVYICSVLHAGYVAALADSLRTRQISEAELNLEDRTTKRTLDETRALIEVDRAGPGRGRRRAQVQPVRARTYPVPSRLPLPPLDDRVDDLVRGIAALRTGEPERVRAVLRWYRGLPIELLPMALPLLDDPELGEDVRGALQRVAPLHVGLFSDVLLGASQPLAVRRAMPALLEPVATQRSAEALVDALSTDRFELRFRSATALSKMVERAPHLELSSATVMDAVTDTLFEARRGRWGRQEEGLLLGFALTALSAVLPSGPLRLALEAVADEDDGHRGTGLEYLDNVLPERLREALTDALQSRSAARSAARPSVELLAELDRSSLDELSLERLIERFRDNPEPDRPSRSTARQEF